MALQLAAGLGRQGMIWLLPWAVKVGSYLGTAAGMGRQRMIGSGRQGMILPWRWHWLLPLAALLAALGLHSSCTGLHSGCTGLALAAALGLHSSCTAPAFYGVCILAALALHS